MLGLIDRTIIYDLILAIHQNAPQRVSQLLMQFRQQALDVSLVLDQLISTLHELALLQYLPELSLKYSDEINQKYLHCRKLYLHKICSSITKSPVKDVPNFSSR